MSQSKARPPKPFIPAWKASTAAGWTWTLKGSGHWTVRNPAGEFVIATPGTMYDGTTTRKVLGRLRKAGCPGA